MDFDLNHTPIKAAQAWDNALRAMAQVDITEELSNAMRQIKLISEAGGLATATQQTMSFIKAEKLAIELEELGYWAQSQPANMKVNNELQAYVYINWKTMPANNRERCI